MFKEPTSLWIMNTSHNIFVLNHGACVCLGVPVCATYRVQTLSRTCKQHTMHDKSLHGYWRICFYISIPSSKNPTNSVWYSNKRTHAACSNVRRSENPLYIKRIKHNMRAHFINTKVNIFVRMEISRSVRNWREECRQWARGAVKRYQRMGWIWRERATTDNEKRY